MKLRDDGCVLCGSTWGDYWEEVDGVRCFFCCETCARQLKNVIEAVRAATGWDRLDSLFFEGDRRGRVARVTHGSEAAAVQFVFDPEARVRGLRPNPPPAGATP